MNKYIAIYNGVQVVIESDTLYRAKLEATRHFKVSTKNEWKVVVALAELSDGTEVVHVAVD